MNELPIDRVLHGDCLELLRDLPDQCVDAVVTDPPYCSGGFNEFDKMAAKSQGSIAPGEWFPADNMTTQGLVWLLRAVLVEARRLLKPNRSALVFTDWRMVPAVAPALESSGLRYRNMIVWDKGHAAMGMGFRPQHEIILEYTNGSTEYQSFNGSNLVRIRRVPQPRREHPTEKPVELLQALIEVVCPRGGIVLDPFSGSGSCGVAAALSGRHFIGCEVHPKYARAAQERLFRHLNPGQFHSETELSLFGEAPAS